MNWTSVVIFFLLALGFSAITNGLFLKFSSNLGSRHSKGDQIRWAKDEKPSFGGITFFIVFLLSIIAFLILDPEGAVLFQNTEFLGFMLAASIGFLTGLFDDAFNTKPLLKLGSQILAGVVLVISGTIINISSIYWLDLLITVFWVIAIMNSINLLDNMDAISSVVTIGIFSSILVIIQLNGSEDGSYAFVIIGLVAALCGFLFYNWNPSKLFMGDTGSMFLGIVLAFLGIKYAWNVELAGQIQTVPLFNRLLLVLIVFLLPITDTTTVFFKRIMSGRSPFQGGKDHTTHHLFYLGLKERKVAMIYIIISLISVFIVLKMIELIFDWNSFMTLGFASYFIFVFGALFFIAHLNRSEDHYKSPEKDKKSA